jgi:hypothetical protein
MRRRTVANDSGGVEEGCRCRGEVLATSGKAEPCPDTGVESKQGSNAAGRRLGPARPGRRFWIPHARFSST